MFLEQLNQLVSSKKSFYSDKLNLISLLIAIAVNIIHWLILLFKIKAGSNVDILIHYNVIYGADFVQKAKFAYLIPLVALIFLVGNSLLSNFYFSKERSASYFLNFSTIAVQVVFLIASIVLVLANS